MTRQLLFVFFSLILLIAYIDMLDSCDRVNSIISNINRLEHKVIPPASKSFDIVDFFAER